MNEISNEAIFYIACAAAALIMVVYYMRRKRRLLSMFFGSFSGLAALFLLNRFGHVIGCRLPLNVFNVTGSAVLGIPFVALLIIIKNL